MDALTAKVLESLVKRALPTLLQNLQGVMELIQAEGPAAAMCDQQTAELVQESIELLGLLTKWTDLALPQPTAQAADAPAPAPAPAGPMSDDEAARMLAEMDGSAPAAVSTPPPAAPPSTGEVSDADALALLAAMDTPSTAPAAPAPVEAPAPTPAPAAKAPTEGHADEATEVVEEIAEFGKSEFSSDADMLKDFLTNADELMETLDEQILALEQEPEKAEIIEEIFRAAHTLKGASGMFGFQAIERVMHRTENFFDQVRKGKQKATSDTIDVVLRAMDIIKGLANGVREGKPSGIKTAPIVNDLNLLCAGKYTRSSSAKSEKAPSKPEGGGGDGHAKEEGGGGAKGKKTEQSTIRVDLQKLDALVNLVGELVIDRTRFLNIEETMRTKGPQATLVGNMSETVQLFGRHMNEIQDIIMKVRMVPIGNAFNKFPRVVRDLAKTLEKEIDIRIEGESTELDKTLVEQIADPLMHLVRNSVDHGIEQPADRVAAGKSPRGTIKLSARQEGNQIVISISDDGKGIPQDRIRQKGIEKGLIKEDDVLSERDIFNLIFEPGFSTAEKVTNISGRGVGMDVVKKQISKLKGIIDISSKQGQGTTMSIQLPLTLAIVQSLLVRSKEEIFAIPQSSVVESIRIMPSEIQHVGEAEVIKRRNMVLPLMYLNESLELTRKKDHSWYRIPVEDGEIKKRKNKVEERLFVVVVGNAERRFGIVVDSLLNQQEMVIKSMGHFMQDIPSVAGGAILGNGEVVLVLDIAELEANFRNKNRQQVAA